MNNNLTIFNNNDFGNVRIIMLNNDPYFVARDVAKALGYAKPENAISVHCRATLKQGILDKTGLQQVTNLIPESDVYRLIIRSQLPTAQKFADWVFEEVLPSIRKTGAYMTDEVIEKTLLDPDFIIKIATQLKEEKNKRKEIEHKFEQAKPKLTYYDTILQSKSLVTISQIAKDYGLSGKAMNETLAKLDIQYKQNGQWLLYSKYQNKGYVSSKTIAITRSLGNTDVVMLTEWTQQGRLFLYELLKKNNILPLIEQNNKLLKQA